MLVIFSDLHLTDESTACNIHPASFKNIVIPSIVRAAERKANEEIHLVLLGDTFELGWTNWWFKNTGFEERPWNGQLDPDTAMNQDTENIERQYLSVLDNVLATESSGAFVEIIKQLHKEAQKNVKITYIIGNHDRAFHNFPSLREKVKELFKPIEVSFDSVILAPEYGVLARHGHEWDENTYGWEFSQKVLKQNLNRFDNSVNKIMTIGEVISTELMGGLIYYLLEELNSNSAEDIEFLRNLQGVNNLRPITDVFSWMGWFTRNQSHKYEIPLRSCMIKALDGVLQSEVSKLWDKLKIDLIVSGDITDRLELFQKAFKKSELDQFERILKVLTSMQSISKRIGNVFSAEKDCYTDGAFQEWENNNEHDMEHIQYVVYGHTHHAKYCHFAGYPDGKVKMYLNTGTFLPLIQSAGNEEGFVMDNRLTMLFFYNADEDKEGRKDNGPTLEVMYGIKRKLYN
jgi:UDP-2,3-diacylglucosamine pyrophosphatase LpxH